MPDLLMINSSVPDSLMINSSEPSLVSSIIEPKPKLIEPKPKLIMNDDDDDDELLHSHAILPLHATPRYITIDDSITLQSRMIHEEMDAHVIDVMTLQKAIVYGTVVASFTIGDFSIHGIKNATQEMIEERFDRLRKITQF